MPGLYVPGRFVKGTNTIRYARYADLATNTTPLVEGTAPTDDALTISSEFFTAEQYGGTVAVTDLAQLDSPHDLISIAAERVAYKATRTMDNLVRDNLHSSAVTSAIFGATGATAVTANAATAVSAAISGWHIKRMVASLLASNVAPFADGFYRLIIHPNQQFDLLTDTSANGFIELNKYVSDLPALTNEIGRFGGCRVVVSSDAFRASGAARLTLTPLVTARRFRATSWRQVATTATHSPRRRWSATRCVSVPCGSTRRVPATASCARRPRSANI